MHWQLWDTDSGNLMACYQTEHEARHGVRDVLAANTPDLFDALALGAMPDDREAGDVPLSPILEGDKLRDWLSREAETIPSSLGEPPAACVARWLGDLGLNPEAVIDGQTASNHRVVIGSRYSLHVLRVRAHDDHSLLVSRLDIGAYADRFAALSERSRFLLVQGLRAELLRSAVEFAGIDDRLDHVELSVRLYDDGLTKDALYRRVTQVMDAVLLVVVLVQSAFDAPAEAATSLDVEDGAAARRPDLRLVTSSSVGSHDIAALGSTPIGSSALSAS